MWAFREDACSKIQILWAIVKKKWGYRGMKYQRIVKNIEYPTYTVEPNFYEFYLLERNFNECTVKWTLAGWIHLL